MQTNKVIIITKTELESTQTQVTHGASESTKL